MNLEEKQLSHDLVYKCFFMKLYEDKVLLPNNKTSKRIYIEHSSAAAILPVTKEGKILLVKQYRYPIKSVSIEIPAGKKDFLGEDGLLCAKRELEEETGYMSDEIEKIIDLNSCVGYSNEMIEVFIAKNCYKLENPKPTDDDEFIELMEFSVKDVKRLMKDKKIQDAKTLVALQNYLLYDSEE